MEQTITISEVFASTGIAPSALRFYERCGLVGPVGRAGGKRVYHRSVIEQLALIDLMQQASFTLSEIADMVDTDGRIDPSWRDSARAKLVELDQRLQRIDRAKTLLEHTLLCEHPTLHDCPHLRGALAAHAETLNCRSQDDTGPDDEPVDDFCPVTSLPQGSR